MTDIKKTLKLTAELETSKIRQELKKLQKELAKGVSTNSNTSSNLKKDLQKITKNFAKDLKKEISAGIKLDSSSTSKIKGDFKRVSKGFSSELKKEVSKGLKADSSTLTKLKKDLKQVAKNFSKDLKTEIDKGLKINKSTFNTMEVSLRKVARTFSKDIKKELAKTKLDNISLSANARSLAKRQDPKKKLLSDETKKIRQEEALRRALQASTLKEKEAKSLEIARRTANATRRGLSAIFGSNFGNMAGDKVGRAMRGGSAAAGLVGRAVGAVGGAAGAVGLAGAAIYGGAGAVRRAYQGQRNQREELAAQTFEQSNLITEGRILESPIRRSARKNLSPLQRAAAAIQGGMSGLLKGAPLQGARAAVAEEGRLEGDVAVEESGPLIQAAQNLLLPSINTRLGSMAGGNMSPGELNNLQGVGGASGFGIQGTNQRLQQARGTLGGKTFSGARGANLLDSMFNLERRMGISTGDQANTLEQIRGQSGMSATQAMSLQKNMIRTSMAAGLDPTKASKFLDTTSNYVSSNSGFADINFDKVSNNIASLSSSFATNAGRDSVNSMDLRRAGQARETIRNESTSTSGIAGLGNILAIQNASKESGVSLNPFQFMALQGTSSDASSEQISEIMQTTGLEKKKANSLGKSLRKQRDVGNFKLGSDLFGDPGVGLAFSDLRGLTTEQNQALMKAREGESAARGRISGKLDSTSIPLGGTETKEFGTQIQKANVELVQFGESFKRISEINELYRQGLLEVVEAFSKARAAFEAQTTSSNQRARSSTYGDGEGEAREPRGLNVPSLGGR